nr:ComEC/Rec2 family competence protein [Frigidibacter sp. ROC022]
MLLPWVPVWLGAGIGWYFHLMSEPSAAELILAAGAACLLALGGAHGRRGPGILLLAPALACAGLALAGARAHGVAAPVLGFRYYGPIEGRVIAIDRSASQALRLTLDRVVLARMAPGRTPERVRVSLHGPQGYVTPVPGMLVIVTGHLSPPEGPVAPRAYDFRRQAWFDRLGAVGYTRTPLLMLAPPEPGPDLWFGRLRMRLSAQIRAGLPGQAGAFAAAIMTGDRSALNRQTSETLRGANLSHLLAISGLHMVLLCGTVFAALRFGLALIPALALRWPLRKLAAAVALAAGLFYDLLSGRAIPAERAWVMVAVMFGAVLVDRRAISLRSVALAALVVLVTRPESLTEPGFQMSFAATVALVAAFAGLRAWRGWRPPRWSRPAVTVLIASAVAGLATAPFAAAHFNRIADYGLLANLLSVPPMGAAVMPLAVLWAVLAPLGLGGPVLWLMGWPVRWILGVAAWVAGLEGAVTPVPAPPGAVLPLIAAGGLILALWQGRGRLAGLAPLALGLLLWTQVERPALLVAGEGALLGLMTEEGRALSKARGQGFAAKSWLEDDGDRATQDAAARRPGMRRLDGEVALQVAGLRLRQFSGRGGAERAAAACGSADILMLTGPAPERPACLIWDRALMRATGPLAIWVTPDGPRIETVAGTAGRRLWTPPANRLPRLLMPAGMAARARVPTGERMP